MDVIERFIGFDWDAGNRGKSWTRHRVSDDECEELFFNLPLVLVPDAAHSAHEARHYVLGKTNGGRRLFVALTMRSGRVRVISARDMTRKVRRAYDAAEKTDA